MNRCPRCGYQELSMTIPDRFDVAVHRLGDVTFESPPRLTKSGLYMVGRNEDGRAILTRAGLIVPGES